ncbi:MAG: autotransporter domain-containing protein, partial [Methylococcales symbiont of Hymedesmia sp. n. MRB-2018]
MRTIFLSGTGVAFFFNTNRLESAGSIPNTETSVTVEPRIAAGITATFVVSGTSADGSALTVDAGTGRVTGLADGANIIRVVVTAEDRTTEQTYTITLTREVSDPVIAISPSIVNAVVGTAIDPVTIVSTGGTVASYAISPEISGIGLSFNTMTGIISGIPTAVADEVPYTITATNAASTNTATVTITVTLPELPAIATSVSIVKAVVGTAIVPVTIDSTGGTVASYAISPAISNNLSFDATTGTISGTPTAVADEVPYTITAINAATRVPGTAPVTATVAITVTPPVIATSVSIVNAVVGTAIVPVTIDSTGGTVSSYTINPEIENGLSFSTTTGTISGIPTAVADEVPYTITATYAATDVPGTAPVTATATVAITVTTAPVAETQVLNAVLPQLLRATTKITVDNISNRIDQAFSSSPADTDASLNLGGRSSLQELINNNARTTLQDGLNIKQMFNNSSFLIPLNVAGDNNYGINNITLWGSGDYLSLEDDVSAVDWEGEVIGGSVGIDARLNQNLIAGAALSYSEGDVDYKRDGG